MLEGINQELGSSPGKNLGLAHFYNPGWFTPRAGKCDGKIHQDQECKNHCVGKKPYTRLLGQPRIAHAMHR